ncbi:aromatic amino acid transport family protein [Dyella sp. C11]|uniref:aromatic amino acid transport family protein n=1 Tax=Dyella sp. C11 TaxID=2126991 RepID=UPI001300214F|nr:aromatic amino acid transport family protein [Dyella sp. C11]
MNDHRPPRGQFNPSALLGFLAFCVILGVLISFHSRNVDRISAYLFLGLRAAIAMAFVWVVWSSRIRGKAKPRWYRKWFLGEDDR